MPGPGFIGIGTSSKDDMAQVKLFAKTALTLSLTHLLRHIVEKHYHRVLVTLETSCLRHVNRVMRRLDKKTKTKTKTKAKTETETSSKS